VRERWDVNCHTVKAIMTLRITWLAHAATAATRRAAFPADEPIETKARTKVADLAGVLGRADRVLIAPERRARETAGALGLGNALVEPALRDCDYGRWIGRTLLELQDDVPQDLAAWLSDPEAAPHGGESIAALGRRVAAWLERIDIGEGRLLVISHPAVLRAAVTHVLQAPPAACRRIDVGPLSRLVLSRQGAEWRLQALISPASRSSAPRTARAREPQG
jgi:broad specificity phosphatase PhoE